LLQRPDTALVSSMSDMRFWYHLPVKVSVAHTLQCAEKAEKIGFDVVSMMDHFVYKTEGRGSIPECWTMLAAVAARTRLTVTPLVMCSLFRNPALVAKMVATLDQITEGRVYLALGAGWWEEEFRAYGYEWMSPKGRVDRTIEAAEIIKRLWTEEEVDYRGRFWRLERCRLFPRPFTKPHPLLLNGGGGPRMMKMAGEICDGWITATADPERFSKQREKIESYAGDRELVFVDYLTIEEGKFSFDDARRQIEKLIDVGVSDFDIILDPDSSNVSMLDECKDLISDFR